MQKPTFLDWKDDLAWTENFKQFQAAAKREAAILRAAHRPAAGAVDRLARRFQAAAEAFPGGLTWIISLGAAQVEVQQQFNNGGGPAAVWRWRRANGSISKWTGVLNLDAGILPDGRAIVVQTSPFTEHANTDNEVTAFTEDGRKLWSHPKEVGGSVALWYGRVFFLEAASILKYRTLVSVAADTGKDRRVHYRETDPSATIELIRCQGYSLFLKAMNAGAERLYALSPTGAVKQLEPRGAAFHPVGTGPSYLVRVGTLASPWEARGPISEWLRGPIHEGVEAVLQEFRILITRSRGCRSIWRISADGQRQHLGTFVAEFVLNLWKFWLPSVGITDPETPLSVWAVIPGQTLTEIQIPARGPLRIVPPKEPRYAAPLKTGLATGAEGLPVRWILIRPRGRAHPKGLLIYCYGAYGSPTHLDTTRWRPWIEAGWAVGCALVRGGGDDTEMWADLGRMGGREDALEDLDACIRALQTETGCAAAETILFGRSAGGLMVGGFAARHPHGLFVRNIYAEAPYVDLLKTASNPELPLTPFEYREFGEPTRNPYRFEEALRISPVHRLGPEGAPGLRVLCRAGTFDKNVYPYEALKWILRLRGDRPAPDEKFLKITAEGHFASGKQLFSEHAEDFLLFQSLLANRKL